MDGAVADSLQPRWSTVSGERCWTGGPPDVTLRRAKTRTKTDYWFWFLVIAVDGSKMDEIGAF
uniref:Uncharacterized protein n=1 Tax=Knipowitschia caucasica TaxID=637954 RepID=A0AAV2LUQ5_KNICA